MNSAKKGMRNMTIVSENIDNVKQLEAQRECFIASLGHDLKNPTLAQIRALELLLKGNFGKLADSQREILEMVLDSCRYMSSMLASFLSTYRYQSGVVKLVCEDFSLLELVNECVGEMVYLATDKDIAISINKECKSPIVWGDKLQIKRVIMNLLSNGIKYAYKESELKIFVYNEDDKTCFRFENKSPYISPEKKDAIFAPYVSFAEKHKELGIGLGLHASKKIVDAHDGEIFVESYENDVTIFGFKIPNTAINKNIQRTVTF